MSTDLNEKRRPNRLANETSPYLLQHAFNPVDWHPWGSEAFEKALAEEKPIFLSVGYSSCHWCHVMERETFESDEAADALNRGFVSIKVDREERPDLDEIYMSAVQLLTQRGGWPMSVWLLPDGRPFHGGTYYPRQSFIELLRNISEIYRTRRGDVTANAERLTQYMKELNAAEEPSAGSLGRATVDNALSRMSAAFDETQGGLKGAPKFPPSSGLSLMLYEYERRRTPAALRWSMKTLDEMARGGIRDHLGGGFHRYSTDSRWLLPHFEKMLYDNAQLSRIYADAFRLTGDADYRAAATEIYEWVLREMTSEEGGFYSTLDADSEGEEGKFYVWSHAEILSILGEEDGAIFNRVYNAEPAGNYSDEATRRSSGLNILHLTRPFSEIARERSEDVERFEERIAKMRERLLEARSRRVRPALDDKILASWNGLMIGSLALGGRILERPDYVDAAVRAADFVLNHMRREGRLLRSYRLGEAKLPGILEDHSFLCHAFLDLHESTGEERWLNEANALADAMLRLFRDEARGGFFNVASDHEAILMRTKSSYDQAIPSGNSMAILSLIRLAKRTGDADRLRQAGRALDAFLGVMQRNPMGVETMILAAALYLDQAAEAGISIEEETLSASANRSRVSVQAVIENPILSSGDRSSLKIEAEIEEGWHINGFNPAQDYLIPTQIRLSTNETVSYGTGAGPEPEILRGEDGEETTIYRGVIAWEIPFLVSQDAKPGRIVLRAYFDFQPCGENSCLEPETLIVEAPLEIR